MFELGVPVTESKNGVRKGWRLFICDLFETVPGKENWENNKQTLGKL